MAVGFKATRKKLFYFFAFFIWLPGRLDLRVSSAQGISCACGRLEETADDYKRVLFVSLHFIFRLPNNDEVIKRGLIFASFSFKAKKVQ